MKTDIENEDQQANAQMAHRQLLYVAIKMHQMYCFTLLCKMKTCQGQQGCASAREGIVRNKVSQQGFLTTRHTHSPQTHSLTTKKDSHPHQITQYTIMSNTYRTLNLDNDWGKAIFIKGEATALGNIQCSCYCFWKQIFKLSSQQVACSISDIALYTLI